MHCSRDVLHSVTPAVGLLNARAFVAVAGQLW